MEREKDNPPLIFTLRLIGAVIFVLLSWKKPAVCAPRANTVNRQVIETGKIAVLEYGYTAFIGDGEGFAATIEGTITYGVEESRIKTEIKQGKEGIEITVRCPRPEIISNSTEAGSLTIYREKRGIFRRTSREKINRLIARAAEQEEKNVENLTRRAEERLREIITARLKSAYGEEIFIKFFFTDTPC